jgi:hypothetical protein
VYRWVVLLHVLGAFTFVMAHGASASVTFKLRRETSRERIAALLDLSSASLRVMYLALLVMLLAGLAVGFWGSWWSRGWIWLTLGLVVAESAAMWAMATRPFSRLRQALGPPHLSGGEPQPAVPPAGAELVIARSAAIHPLAITVVGFGGLALMLWLMLLKPF